MTRASTRRIGLLVSGALAAALLPLAGVGGTAPASASPALAPCFGGVAGNPADAAHCDTALGLHTISGRATTTWGGEITVDSGFSADVGVGGKSVTWRFAFETVGMTIVSGCTSDSSSCKVRWKPYPNYAQAFQIDATLRQGIGVLAYKAVEGYAPPPLRLATVLPKDSGGTTLPAFGNAYAVRGGAPTYASCVDPLDFEAAGATDAQCVILKPGGNLGVGPGWSAYLPTNTSWVVYAGRHGLTSSPATDSGEYPPVGLGVPNDDPVTVTVTPLPRAALTITPKPSPIVVGLGQTIPVTVTASLPAGTGGAFRFADWIDVLARQAGSTGTYTVTKPADLSFDVGPGQKATLPLEITGTALGSGTAKISARASVGSVTGNTETVSITVPFTVQKDPVPVDPPIPGGTAPKAPVVTLAVGPKSVRGTVTSSASTAVKVLVYLAAKCPVATSPSTGVGSKTVTTNAAGKASWAVAATKVLPYGQVVFARAQVGGKLSARSACKKVLRPATVAVSAPKTAVRGKTTYATITVTAPGVVPAGKVTVTVGTTTKVATLVKGKVRVAIPGLGTAGTKTVVVSYKGSTTVAPATKKVSIKVT